MPAKSLSNSRQKNLVQLETDSMVCERPVPRKREKEGLSCSRSRSRKLCTRWQQQEVDFGDPDRDVHQARNLIVDPFYGSGTLGAAAMMRNRDFFGIEKEPKTVETAEKRVERLAKKIVLPSYFPGKNPAEILDHWEKQGNNGGDPNEVEVNPTDRPDEQKVVQAESFEENGKEYIPTEWPGVYNVILKGRKPDEPKNVASSDIGGDGEELPN